MIKRIAAALGLLLFSAVPTLAAEDDAARIAALGPEAQKAFEADDAKALALIGRDFERGVNGRTQDDDAAFLLFRTACDRGAPEGCNGLGFLYHRGRGVDRSFKRAAALFKSSCEGGLSRACSNYGHMLEWGQGVALDYAAARALYRQSCDADFLAGCIKLGQVYEYGKGVDRDASAASAAYRRAIALEPENAQARSALQRLEQKP